MSDFIKNKWKYVIIIISILLVAGLGSIFVNLGLDWFNELNKPSQFVPAFVFGIVWTIIYALFAIILCIWVSKSELDKSTITMLLINGILNILWCLIFFTVNNAILGLIAIIVNLIFAYLLIINIFSRVKIYGYILSIYPLWISIATTLNLALWILN